MKKFLVPYLMSLAAFVTLFLFGSFGKTPDFARGARVPDGANAFQEVRAIKMPSSLDFCGEAVPLENFDARERFDRELHDNAFKYGSMLQIFKLSGRIFPIIEPIMAENGIPQDFKYLAVAESALRDLTSPAGARGVWQFMPATARQYGLVVNDEVDERMNLDKVTRAACRYLNDGFRRYNNWTLTAASYNAGMGGVSTNMAGQKGTDYYGISMSEETNRYVFRILSFKEIMRNAPNYGFFLDADDYYSGLSTSLVEVAGTVPNWGDFAQQYSCSYRQLKALNPWIIANHLTNKERKQYLVRVPLR